jgi:serine O-acetyltransferase
MSHRLDDVLEAVLESYVQHPHIGKIGETQFPKRHLILAVLKKLQYVIFPGFFDQKELRSDNIRFYTGQLLEEISEVLTAQIAKTLRLFTEAYCDAPDDVVQKRAEEIVDKFLAATDNGIKGQ